MNKETMKRILNVSALSLLLMYVVGIVLMLVAFRTVRFGDDFEFAFAFYYFVWGGVATLVGILILMIAKTVIIRE